MIIPPDGTPITKPTEFCGLCNYIIRKIEKGAQNCYKSASMISEFNLIGGNMKKCLAGLWGAGVTIKVGDKHIANWLIGQVRSAGINEENRAKYC